MRFFLTRLRARVSRAHLLAVAAGAVAMTVGIVLALTGTAQASNEPWYLQPAPDTQQLQAWSGKPEGQTASPASYASVLCVGSTLNVSVHLIRTNEPRTAFQMFYMLDNDSDWIPVEDTFTTGWSGTGWGAFTVDDISAGVHQVALDINPVVAGGTYYLNQTRNNGGTIGIYFSCPPPP